MILRSGKNHTDANNIIDLGIQNRNVKRKERKNTCDIEMKVKNVDESQIDQSLEIVDVINKPPIATMSSPIQCSTVHSRLSDLLSNSIIDLSSEDIVVIPHNDTHPDVEVLNSESQPVNITRKRKRGDQNMSMGNNEVIDVENTAGLSLKKDTSDVDPLFKINITGVKRKRALYNFETKLNDSIEILHEFNRVDVIPSDKKKQRMNEGIEIDISNQSIINLCDDEDVMIVDRKSLPLEDSKKPDVDVKNGIIPLDKGHNVQLIVTTGSTTCTVPNRKATSAGTKQTLPKFERVSNSVARYEPYVYNPPVHTSSYSYMVPYYFVDTLGDTSHPQNDIWSATKKNNTTSAHSNQSTEVPTLNNVYGSNIYNPNPQNVQTGLRPVIIDGSNVAFSHSIGNKVFSSRGLEICVNYFLKRGHKVVAFVPQFRKSSPHVMDRSILEELERNGLLVFTPSRRVEGHLQVPYDDRYIVQYAAEMGGVIVSTDNYRDLLQENESWRDTIQNRLLMFTWVGDLLMFPQDPLGRYGPNLEEFLCFPS